MYVVIKRSSNEAIDWKLMEKILDAARQSEVIEGANLGLVLMLLRSVSEIKSPKYARHTFNGLPPGTLTIRNNFVGKYFLALFATELPPPPPSVSRVGER